MSSASPSRPGYKLTPQTCARDSNKCPQDLGETDWERIRDFLSIAVDLAKTTAELDEGSLGARWNFGSCDFGANSSPLLCSRGENFSAHPTF